MKKEVGKGEILLVIAVFTLVIMVSGVDAQTNCCAETNDGKICEDLPSSSCSDLCSQSCAQLNCSLYDSCKIGCCIRPDGTCGESSPKGKCEQGGRWDSERMCSIDVCKKGCCIIQGNAELYTKNYCYYRAKGFGVDSPEFYPETTGIAACRAKAAGIKRGACVTVSQPENKCRMATEQECLSKNPPGYFYADFLCTAKQLGTECKPTRETKCFEAKDEVYFLDSCGNPANIYDSSKIDNEGYWETIVSKEGSCGYGRSNADSVTCGNCDIGRGSVCDSAKVKPDWGNYACRNLNCVDGNGRERHNGESWCAYDGVVGNGSDIVGSRHWRFLCQYGEIISQPCADYRNEICVQNDAIAVDGSIFSSSACKINQGPDCYSYNYNENGKFVKKEGEIKGMMEKCLGNSYCFLKKVDVDSGFKFAICLPKIPPGFDYSSEEGINKSKNICGIASQTCKITYRKNFNAAGFSWDCEQNCECETKKFAEEMNNFCARLGDCGMKMNIAGDVDEAYTVKGSSKVKPSVVGSNIPIPGFFISEEYLMPEIGKLNLSILQGAPYNSYEESPAIVTMKAAFIPFTAGISWGIGAGIEKILGLGETKIKKAIFTCLPWQSPQNGDKCQECNKDPVNFPCSKYRCQSLGQYCKLLNEGEGGSREICDSVPPNDIVPPKISFDSTALSSGYSYELFADGVKINKDGGCVEAYSKISFGISVDKPSQCKISSHPITDFEDNSISFFQDSLYNFKHQASFTSPSKLTGEDSEFVLDEIGETSIYARCRSGNNMINNKDYLIRICVKPEPDVSAPIVSLYPSDKVMTGFNSSEGDAVFYTDEPAECKWSRTDNDFIMMEEIADCEYDTGLKASPGGCDLCRFSCNMNISDLKKNEEKVYIRCRDQPFDSVPIEKRNKMDESSILTFISSPSSLAVSLEPNGVLIDGVEPKTIDITARTSGGAEDGKAVCNYLVLPANENRSFGGEFFMTGGIEHKQPGIYLYSGDYIIKATCIDSAGNMASASNLVSFVLDLTAPVITRAYYLGGYLTVITDESGKCRYSNNVRKGCNFNFDNATRMNDNEIEHTASWSNNQYYYIKCEDIWGNQQGECGIKIRTIK